MASENRPSHNFGFDIRSERWLDHLGASGEASYDKSKYHRNGLYITSRSQSSGDINIRMLYFCLSARRSSH
ncbi:unnamed protein product [Aureobasidium pullulans]|nr:unnamed protein product [Aureobasidium pullulans]